MSSYVELQVTTNYSFLRGASHVEELFVQAKALGYAPSASPTTTRWPASPARMAAPRRSASAWSSAAGSTCATACRCWSTRSTGPATPGFAAC